jgi:hypothetical protein
VLVRQPSTGTASVSSSSAVAGTSRIDLAPLHVTTAGVRAIWIRSAEMSSDSAKPRCTPPMPPVAMNDIPASRQIASVPPTVVEPTAP